MPLAPGDPERPTPVQCNVLLGKQHWYNFPRFRAATWSLVVFQSCVLTFSFHEQNIKNDLFGTYTACSVPSGLLDTFVGTRKEERY